MTLASPKLSVISDIHIWGSEDPCYRALLSMIRAESEPGSVVVLAGDIFDFLVGNRDALLKPYDEFLQLLMQRSAAGTIFHYIEGNHDFHLRGAFAQVPGMIVHDSEMEMTFGGQRFFVAHGDLADTRDWGYLGLRVAFRSLPVKAAIQAVPSSVLKWIGEKSSGVSRRYHPRLPESYGVEELRALRKVYRNYAAEKIAEGFDYVVLGHCHDLDEMSFRVGNHEGCYYNVGFPRRHMKYLRFDSESREMARERFF